jgi:serine/threonine protein kinase
MGKYTKREKFAQGGMAEIYKAYQPELEREVVIKKLSPKLKLDPEFAERFRREAKIAASLNHPNIITIYDFGEEEDGYFIVMEYVKGYPLEKIIAKRQTIPELGAMISYELAEALQYAHNYGVIHRDIKPANIILTEQGVVKLMDFGIARMRGSSSITREGSFVGTPYYISPEQAQGKEVDARSDIFSLGVVLYELATGELPFKGDEPQVVVINIISQEFKMPSVVNQAVSFDLEAIIKKALAKDKKNRFESMEEMRKELYHYLNLRGLTEIRVELKKYLNAPQEYLNELSQRMASFYLERSRKFKADGERTFSILDLKTASKLAPSNIEIVHQIEEIGKEKKTKPRFSRVKAYSLSIFFLLLVSSLFILTARYNRMSEVKLPLPKITARAQKEGTKVKPKPVLNQKSSREEKKLSLPSRDQKKEEKPTLPPKVEVKDKGYGYLAINTEPWSVVIIDGVEMGKAPTKKPFKLPAGWHTLRLINNLCEPLEVRVLIKKGERVEKFYQLKLLEPIPEGE